MSMKALDALRGWVDHIDENGHLGRLSDFGKQGLRVIADAIEAEITERFMELPVGADGVPIHVGDALENVPGGWALTADMLEIDRYGNHVRMNGQSRVPCECCRHIKPRTIEDVLRDCCNEWNEHCGDDWESGVYAKYAAELRELMGGTE